MAGRKGRSGRKPKPANLRVIEGNPGKRPLPDPSPVELVCPDRPKWIDLLPDPPKKKGEKAPAELVALRRDAQAAWDTTIRQLDAMSMLGRVDATVVVDYCICSARLAQCERELSRIGVTITDPKTGAVRRNPALTAANMYRQQLRFYVGELGLSPSARMRLNTPGGGGADDPDEAELFG